MGLQNNRTPWNIPSGYATGSDYEMMNFKALLIPKYHKKIKNFIVYRFNGKTFSISFGWKSNMINYSQKKQQKKRFYDLFGALPSLKYVFRPPAMNK